MISQPAKGPFLANHNAHRENSYGSVILANPILQ